MYPVSADGVIQASIDTAVQDQGGCFVFVSPIIEHGTTWLPAGDLPAGDLPAGDHVIIWNKKTVDKIWYECRIHRSHNVLGWTFQDLVCLAFFLIFTSPQRS